MPYKKLTFYRPGLISLIGIPIMMLFVMPPAPKSEKAIRLNLPNDYPSVNNDEPIKFTSKYVIKEAKKHKVETIYWEPSGIVGFEDYIYQRNKRFIQNEIERLQFTHDTSRVLKIQLTDDNTYGDFVWLVNQAMLYKYKRFAHVNDAFYFFPNPPLNYHKPIIIELPYDTSRVVSNYTPPSQWEIFKRDLYFRMEYPMYVAQDNYLILLGFFFLIVIPSIFFIRYSKKKGIVKELDN